MKLNFITLVIIAVCAVIFARHAMGLPWTFTRIIGLAISAPALLLLVLARTQLGRAFSVRAKASNLVINGLYSRIRNPIYVFSTFLIVGVIIFTGAFWLLLALVVIIPLQIYRSRKESEVLQAKFGAEYLAYKQKTWF